MARPLRDRLRHPGDPAFRPDLQPDEEDGLPADDRVRGSGDVIAWIRLPHVANLTDCQPWWNDAGVQTRWVTSPEELLAARAIILPGTKNTLADLRWLRERGLADAIIAAARRGVLIIGICGGFQMLGTSLADEEGRAGDSGHEGGLGLLPARTEFSATKILRQVTATCDSAQWRAYEIHMGRTSAPPNVEPLQVVSDETRGRDPKACVSAMSGGTYLHGWFDSPQLRARVAAAAGMSRHKADPMPWAERRAGLYRDMAEHLAAHVNLDPIRRYLCL